MARKIASRSTRTSQSKAASKAASPPNSGVGVEVKLGRSTPAGATAVAEFVTTESLQEVEGAPKGLFQREDFTGAHGKSVSFTTDTGATRTIIGLGASDKLDRAKLRQVAATFARSVAKHERIAIVAPTQIGDIDTTDAVRVIAEAARLGLYRFDRYKSEVKLPTTYNVTIVVESATQLLKDQVNRGNVTAKAVTFARDLVNEPGGVLTPREFVARATERAEAAGLSVEVLDEKGIAKERLGGLLAVNQGSNEPPRLLKLRYSPAGKGKTQRPPLALVGKGITFDSGGLSLKPAEAMMEMKCDMAGAAAVVATMCAIAELNIPMDVVSFTPLTDNMVNGGAQRPGDIYTSRSGKSIEVLNTDAEGRLVLAEALTLASEEEPAAIIDLATLTGACMVALGAKIAGLLSNDDELVDQIKVAAKRSGEQVWQLPLADEYRSQLDSPIADLKNIGTRFGGTITAALFLSEFVGEDIPWAHLDIAGPAFQSDASGDNAAGATGYGVRTLIDLIESWPQD